MHGGSGDVFSFFGVTVFRSLCFCSEFLHCLQVQSSQATTVLFSNRFVNSDKTVSFSHSKINKKGKYSPKGDDLPARPGKTAKVGDLDVVVLVQEKLSGEEESATAKGQAR